LQALADFLDHLTGDLRLLLGKRKRLQETQGMAHRQTREIDNGFVTDRTGEYLGLEACPSQVDMAVYSCSRVAAAW